MMDDNIFCKAFSNIYQRSSPQLVHPTTSIVGQFLWNPSNQVCGAIHNQQTPSLNIRCTGEHSPREGEIPMNIYEQVRQGSFEHSRA